MRNLSVIEVPSKRAEKPVCGAEKNAVLTRQDCLLFEKKVGPLIPDPVKRGSEMVLLLARIKLPEY